MTDEIVLKYYVGTEEDCLSYNEEVKAVKNYSGTTTDWVKPIKHPSNNEWAILKEPSVDTEIETLTGVEELDASWNAVGQ